VKVDGVDRYAVDGGATMPLSPVLPGLHVLDMPDATEVARSVVLRIEIGGTPVLQGPAITATPTAESMTRFLVDAEGWSVARYPDFDATDPAAMEYTALGTTAASDVALNAPLRIEGVGEIELRSGMTQPGHAHYGTDNSAHPTPTVTVPPAPDTPHLLPSVLRVFDPVGFHHDLAPGSVRTVTWKCRITGDAVDRDGAAVVLGRSGRFAVPAVSAVALDADGDPVSFRFDRLLPVGRLRDGRPFVVAPEGAAITASPWATSTS